MCVEGGFFFKISKRDFTFIREMRVGEDFAFCGLLRLYEL